MTPAQYRFLIGELVSTVTEAGGTMSRHDAEIVTAKRLRISVDTFDGVAINAHADKSLIYSLRSDSLSLPLVQERGAVPDDYTPTMDEICTDWSFVRGQAFDPGAQAESEGRRAMFTRALAAHDAEKRAEQETDDEPCTAEIWSWDIFRHQQVDPYWMRCHLVGAHEKHENSETGATWRLPVPDATNTESEDEK